MAVISRYFRCRMVNLSAVSTDSCLLHVLQEESARTPPVAAKTYMHDKASACISSVPDGRKEEYTKIGSKRARSRPHRGSRGSAHCFITNLHVQDVSYSMGIIFSYPKNQDNINIFILTFLSNRNTISIIYIFLTNLYIFISDCILLKRREKYSIKIGYILYMEI